MLRSFLACAAAATLLQSGSTLPYRDAAGRFSFSYPTAFGAPSAGTNDGFMDRVAAIRFSAFPAQFGGEAVLTRGFPLVDLQAVGGLYDSVTLEIFPDHLRAVVVGQLPRLTSANFCAALSQSRHVDPDLPAFRAFTPPQKQAIGQTDVMRNVNPRVVECRRVGDMVSFDKERAFQPGYPTQHVYGAVRFVGEPFSTFQLIAGGASPDRALRSAIEDVVSSFASR